MKEDVKTAIQIAHRLTLGSYIRQCAALYGEDPAFTAEYVKEQVAAWDHDLEKAISCFKQLVDDKKRSMNGKC